MSRPNSVTTFFRLSRDEAHLIHYGLLRVISGYHLWQHEGSSRISPAADLFMKHRVNEGEFSEACQAVISHALDVATDSFIARSRRLRLDLLELAACILAARVTEMMYRHGHFRPAPSDYKIRCRRLVRRLERLRKRAKRAYIRVYGTTAFAEVSRCWQEHVRFVRSFFLFCTCGRTLVPGPSRKKLRRLIENDWIAYYRTELPALGREVPAEDELRGLIRRSLRVARRFIRQYGRKTAHELHDVLQQRMVNYVVRRCRKTSESPMVGDDPQLQKEQLCVNPNPARPVSPAGQGVASHGNKPAKGTDRPQKCRPAALPGAGADLYSRPLPLASALDKRTSVPPRYARLEELAKRWRGQP